MTRFETWRERASQLRREVYALYLAYKDPRVPWYAKLAAACVVAYVFNPIDLIPDFIPVLGYLDDLLVVPLGIYLVLKWIPDEVMAECRQKAQAAMSQPRPTNWLAAGIIVVIWIIVAALVVLFAFRAMK